MPEWFQRSDAQHPRVVPSEIRFENSGISGYLLKRTINFCDKTIYGFLVVVVLQHVTYRVH